MLPLVTGKRMSEAVVNLPLEPSVDEQPNERCPTLAHAKRTPAKRLQRDGIELTKQCRTTRTSEDIARYGVALVPANCIDPTQDGKKATIAKYHLEDAIVYWECAWGSNVRHGRDGVVELFGRKLDRLNTWLVG